MSVMMITTHGYAENNYDVDPALFAVDRYLEHRAIDDGMAVTVQCADSDGIYVHVYTDHPWAQVRREIMDMAALFEQPLVIIIMFGSIINVNYGPSVEEGWVEADDDDEDEEPDDELLFGGS